LTWLVWRQHRASAAISAALLAAFAALVVFTGLQVAAHFHAAFGSCLAAGSCRFPNDDVTLDSGPVGFIIEFTLAVPALLGMFLGAPLVAREIETGTGQFAWTQGVTRRHWLAYKVGWLLLAALAWGGAVGALVTWWSGPKNTAYANAFSPGTFDVQGIMPAAYSLFAMALGIAAGMLIRRILPALGFTLFGYFGVRLIVMGWIRQHYMTPVTTTFSIAQDSPADYLPRGAFWRLAQGFRGPNGPISLPNSDSVQVVGNGFPLSAVPSECLTHSGPHPTQHILSCLANHGYAQYVTYQPATRYWPFQFIEAGIFAALAAVLIAVAFAVINRRDA
jgi:ABC-type transport system involved in multi-copper enzyme maturation permease subunit